MPGTNKLKQSQLKKQKFLLLTSHEAYAANYQEKRDKEDRRLRRSRGRRLEKPRDYSEKK